MEQFNHYICWSSCAEFDHNMQMRSLDFSNFFMVACGLATTWRVEGWLPRLELAFGFHFFIKINALEDECYNSCTYFDLFYPGPTCFKQEERCAKIAKMIRIVWFTTYLVLFIYDQWIEKKPLVLVLIERYLVVEYKVLKIHNRSS